MARIVEEVLAVRIPEAARRLSVSRDTVAAAITRGDIRSVRFGGCVLIPVAELERILGIERAEQPTPKELLEMAAALVGEGQ